MEENINMTAARSLEIITEQIAQSRRVVSKTTGQSLFVAGLCTMGMAALVFIVNLLMAETIYIGFGHLLWLILPVIIWFASRIYIKEREHAPVSLVSSLVGKTWSTFAVFCLGFFLIALAWSFVASRLMSPSEYLTIRIRITPIIVLLMGMAITITGHILKQHWLVVFGSVAGLVFFVWEHFGMWEWFYLHLTATTPQKTAAFISSTPCLTIFLFALFGLMLPGLLLKNQK